VKKMKNKRKMTPRPFAGVIAKEKDYLSGEQGL
jgi:hypothetical protein